MKMQNIIDVASGPNGGVHVNLESGLTSMDMLAIKLGYGQAPLRSKQGVFYPSRLVLRLAHGYHYTPPPALVVQFDKHGQKNTFAVPVNGVPQ